MTTTPDPGATPGPVLALGDLMVDVLVQLVRPDGERAMLPDAGANLRLTAADLPPLGGESYRHLHVSGYTLLRPVSRPVGLTALGWARQAGLTVSMDGASSAPLRPLVGQDPAACLDSGRALGARAVAQVGARPR